MQIGAFEAKTRFSQILEDVQKGVDYIITKRGKPVAKLIPFQEEPKMTRQQVFEELEKFKKLYRGKPGSFNIREAIEDGRR